MSGTYFSNLPNASSVDPSDTVMLHKPSPSTGLGEGTVYKVTVTQVSAAISVAPSQITQAGATTGQALVYNGSAWAPGNVSGAGTPGGSTGQIQYNNSGSFGGLTNAAVTALVVTFSSSLSGAVPPSGGGTTNFLRADGAWAAPASSGGITALTGDVAASGTGSVAATVGAIGGHTVTLGGALTTSGAYSLSLTLSGATSLTLPTSGTLLTSASSVALTQLAVGGGTNGQILELVSGVWTPATIATGGGTVNSGTGPQIAQYASGTSTVVAGVSVSGDATIASGGALTVASIGGKTVTLGGSLITSGAYSVTLTLTGATNVTLPTSGTLLTTTGSSAGLSQATTSAFGVVKPDGTTITISGGIISATGGSSSVSVTAGSPNVVVTPSPGTGTFTIGTTEPINTQTGSSYAIQSSDNTKLIEMTNGSATTLTIAAATTTGFGGGASWDIVPTAAPATITPTTSTIGGLTSLKVTKGQYIGLASDSTNYQVAIGLPPPPSQSGTTYLRDDMTWVLTGQVANDAAAAGTNQSGATQLTLSRNYILSGTGGVKLPQASTFGNATITVFNRTGAAITLYPFSGDTIEANASNVGITLNNNATAHASIDGTGIVRID